MSSDARLVLLCGCDGVAIEEWQRTHAIARNERLKRLRRNGGCLARNDVLDVVMEAHLDSFEFPQNDEAPITVRSSDDLARTLAPRLRPVP